MAKPKSSQLDFRGLEILADEFTLTAGGSPGDDIPTFSELTGSVVGAAGANLQAILEDIVTRLEAVETP